jgi:hypothetical protein
MKPEAAAYLDKAKEYLAKADGMLAQWPDEAGRAAYLAGFHAAQGFIFEQTGRAAKRIAECKRFSGNWREANPSLTKRFGSSLGVPTG